MVKQKGRVELGVLRAGRSVRYELAMQMPGKEGSGPNQVQRSWSPQFHEGPATSVVRTVRARVVADEVTVGWERAADQKGLARSWKPSTSPLSHLQSLCRAVSTDITGSFLHLERKSLAAEFKYSVKGQRMKQGGQLGSYFYDLEQALPWMEEYVSSKGIKKESFSVYILKGELTECSSELDSDCKKKMHK